MPDYTFSYETEQGFKGEYTCSAINSFMAWEQLKEFESDTGLKIVTATIIAVA